MLVVYLLASPLGQLQFQRAESGASGQTAVTEEDIRRFKFPTLSDKQFQEIIQTFEKNRNEITYIKQQLDDKENNSWKMFTESIVSNTAEK